jgi:hypothetical protein
MTEMGKPGGPMGPPWSVDLLADLHAGAVDEAQAEQLWPQVRQDPEAMAVLAALDRTKEDLAGLAQAPAPPMPAEVAARIDAALSAEAARAGGAQQSSEATSQEHVAPVLDLAAARRRRNRVMGWSAGLLTAAAAVAAVALLSPGTTTPGTPLADQGAQPPAQEAPGDAAPPGVVVDPGNPAAAFGDIQGVQDYGPLGDRERLEACLQANDIPVQGQPVGVKVEGNDAVIVVLTTGELARYRIVAVSPDCSGDNPGTVYLDKEFGR